MVKLAPLLSSSTRIDSEFLLTRASSLSHEEVRAVYTPGKIHIRVEFTKESDPSYEKVDDVCKLRGMLEESYQSRRTLQEWITETSQAFTEQSQKQEKLLQESLKELQEAKEALVTEKSNNTQIMHINRRQNTKLRGFKNVVSSLNSQVKNYSEGLQLSLIHI